MASRFSLLLFALSKAVNLPHHNDDDPFSFRIKLAVPKWGNSCWNVN